MASALLCSQVAVGLAFPFPLPLSPLSSSKTGLLLTPPVLCGLLAASEGLRDMCRGLGQEFTGRASEVLGPRPARVAQLVGCLCPRSLGDSWSGHTPGLQDAASLTPMLLSPALSLPLSINQLKCLFKSW